MVKRFMRPTISSESKLNCSKHPNYAKCKTKDKHFQPKLNKTSRQEDNPPKCVPTNADKVALKKSYIESQNDEKELTEDKLPEKAANEKADILLSQSASGREFIEKEKLKLRVTCLEKMVKRLKLKNKKLKDYIKTQFQSEKTQNKLPPKLVFDEYQDYIGESDVTKTYFGCYGDVGNATVKKFKGHLTSSDVTYAQAEVEMLRSLSHENVVGIVALHKQSSVVGSFGCCVVMETTVGGRSLLETLGEIGNRNGMSYADFLPISMSVSQGLRYLHENQPQILHLNLKPSNILLFGDGQTKICDYGFSKLRMKPMRSPDSNYLAPELLSHPVHISSKIDVYSFAVVTYEMMTSSTDVSHLNNKTPGKADKSKETVPKKLYYLIESCVEVNYMRRPNFDEICSMLTTIQNEGLSAYDSPDLLSTKNSPSPKITSPKRSDINNDVINELRDSTRDTLASRVENIKKNFDAKLHGYLSQAENSIAQL